MQTLQGGNKQERTNSKTRLTEDRKVRTSEEQYIEEATKG